MPSNNRSSGILLHITSLPSPYGIGDLGPAARTFVDFLAAAGQQCWQMLPLNPTSPIHGNSPYSSDSAHAGNPALISPEQMLEDGLLLPQDLREVEPMPVQRVQYEQAGRIRETLLRTALNRLDQLPLIRQAFHAFCRREAAWLEDYALFRALKEHYGLKPWTEWPMPVRRRQATALEELRTLLRPQMEEIRFRQFVFFSQWEHLREHCRRRRIKLIGDIPIYVNEDSVDVWANPEIFKLDEELRPLVRAGVPPDYFSTTGQLWGNPVYDWRHLQKTDFSWWIERIRHNTRLFDLVRLDHFRGFVACWEVPAGHDTAMHGQWADVPARAFFTTLRENLGTLPLIAEDLGTITDDVLEVMHEFGLPGMKILLFAFGPDLPTNPYAPHNHIRPCFVYTGTHDNNTVRGWFEDEADTETLDRLNDYLDMQCTPTNVATKLVRLAMQSVADAVIVPMQDHLALDARSKMNVPGVSDGNWSWRMQPDDLHPDLVDHLKHITNLYGRGPTAP